MASDLSLSFKINVDARQGETSLGAFLREAERGLASIGKSKVEIKAIEDIAKRVREGKTAIASLKPEYQKLIAEFNKGFSVNQGRDFFGLKSHAAVRQSIAEIRKAYQDLRATGKLTFAETAQAAMRTEERIRALNEETNGWAASFGKAKSALAGVAASGAGLAYVAREAMRFESAMSGVAKVVDGSDAEIAALSDNLRKLGQSMPVEGGMAGLANMAAAGGQLGIPLAQMEEFVTLAVKMSNAFSMTADEAGQSAAKMMNVFQLPLERVREVADAVNALGNSSAATERDIVEVMTRIGGSARQFGLTAEQSAALSDFLATLSWKTHRKISCLAAKRAMMGRIGASARRRWVSWQGFLLMQSCFFWQ